MITTVTPREREVLDLVIAGKTNVEIAELLGISVHTAKAHVCSLMEKYGVEVRLQLAVKAVKEHFNDVYGIM